MVDRILQVVLARAAETNGRRITRIDLEAGPLSGVVPDSLRFHWADLAAGTIAADADLVVASTDDLVELRLVSFEVEDEPGEVART
jgi:Zn finger protein HypA/HybF involved in hydrogenase expression